MTAKIKLNAASGGGSVSLKAPSTTTSNAAIELQLPVADGSAGQFMKTDGSGNLAFDTVAAGGISMIDTYVLTSNMGMSGAQWNYVKSNFTRVNGAYGTLNFTPLGTGLGANNAGAATNFTYPSTGYYQVTFQSCTYVSSSSSSDYLYAAIFTATDGSTFDNTVQSINYITGHSSTIYETQTTSVIVDVTNTSNDKFYLAIQPEVTSTLLGSSDKFYTYLQVKKLAET